MSVDYSMQVLSVPSDVNAPRSIPSPAWFAGLSYNITISCTLPFQTANLAFRSASLIQDSTATQIATLQCPSGEMYFLSFFSLQYSSRLSFYGSFHHCRCIHQHSHFLWCLSPLHSNIRQCCCHCSISYSTAFTCHFVDLACQPCSCVPVIRVLYSTS